MSEHKGSYRRQFTLGMVGYVVTILLAAFLYNREIVQSMAPAIVVALLPVIPFLYGMAGVIGNAREQDELQQRIYLESALITASLTVAMTFSYGLLELFDLAPAIPLFYIAPLMIMLWGLTNIFLGRRYA
jgi:hypothetical protein